MVSVEHFMDEMDRNECIWILRNLAYADRNLWEATRLKIFSTISMFSKSGMSLTDVVKFAWDKEQQEEPELPHMSDDERKKMEDYVINILNREQNKQ